MAFPNELEIADAEELKPVETYQTEIPTGWPEDAASEQAAFVSLANGGDEAAYTDTRDSLQAQGSSPLMDSTQAALDAQALEADINAAGGIVSDPTVDPETKRIVTQNLQTRVKDGKSVNIADEMTLRLADSADRHRSDNGVVLLG